MPELKEFLVRKSQIIKNTKVFYIDFPPPEIVARRETYDLYREIANFINYRVPNHIIITGPPGTGKTVIIKHVLKELKEIPNIKTRYVNCLDKTDIDIMANVLDQNPGVATINALISKFLRDLDTDIIIVLDEIDKAAKNSLKLLYKLSRPSEIFPDLKHSISLVMISNDIEWPERIPPYIRSSLQSRMMFFDLYTAKQLTKILKQRIKIGFIDENAASEKTISRIVSKTIKKRKSDSRVAMGTLFTAAKYAESKGLDIISEDLVDEAFVNVVDQIEVTRLARLDDTRIFVLYSCLESKEKTMHNIHNHYIEMAEELPIKRLRYTMFFIYLKYLNEQNLIEIKKESGGKFIIKPNVSPKSLYEEFRKRLVKLS